MTQRETIKRLRQIDHFLTGAKNAALTNLFRMYDGNKDTLQVAEDVIDDVTRISELIMELICDI